MAGAPEKGFGTGLRAELEKKQAESSAPPPEASDPSDEPRSVSEAIAVATLQAEGVAELRAELDASRLRESELRASLAAQKGAVEIEQQTVQRTEQLDERMAQLASAEATVAARERAAPPWLVACTRAPASSAVSPCVPPPLVLWYLPGEGAAPTKLTRAGRLSVISTPVASSGPLLVALSV